MDWAAISGAIGVVIGAAAKWAADAHARRRDDSRENVGLLRDLIDTLRRDLRQANERVEALQAAESRCRQDMATVKERLANMEAELTRLKARLGEV